MESPHAHFQIQRPEMKLRDAQGNMVGTAVSDVPDLMLLSGTLPASALVSQHASLIVRFRRGQPFPSEAALVWTIHGEKGELRLTAPAGTTLHAGAYSQPVTLEVHDFAADEVAGVEWRWEDWQEELPVMARSIAMVYERIAEGRFEEVPSFEDAQRRHAQLSGLLEGSGV